MGRMSESLERAADALERVEKLLHHHFAPPDEGQLGKGVCWRWQATPLGGHLVGMPEPRFPALEDLVGLEDEIAVVEKNTRYFLAGGEANHVLITGARGGGKSSIVRGVFGRYAEQGLRLIETDAEGLAALVLLLPVLARRRERYVVYCDDLAFNETGQLFSRIKNAVEGALSASPRNVLIYATSNRRGIVAEKVADNLAAIDEGEVQPLETVDEKRALTDRFGLWVSILALDVAEYERIVRHHLTRMRIRPTAALLQESRRFADQRGGFNGRIARQFAVAVRVAREG